MGQIDALSKLQDRVNNKQQQGHVFLDEIDDLSKELDKTLIDARSQFTNLKGDAVDQAYLRRYPDVKAAKPNSTDAKPTSRRKCPAG